MSTTTSIDHHTAEVGTETKKPGLFDRLIASRMKQGEARVSGYLLRQSDTTLADLGFTADQIAAIRAKGQIPTSFWR